MHLATLLTALLWVFLLTAAQEPDDSLHDQYAGRDINNILGQPHWSTQSPQWWERWPQPKSSALEIEAGEVMRLLEREKEMPGQAEAGAGNGIGNGTAARNFLLVDVRRGDWEGGGAISSSVNVPAHAFYQARPVVYRLCQRAGVRRVIVFCRSSKGRGPRCAGWLQDYVREISGDLEVVVMKGGVKGWAKKYGGRMMDYYDEAYWKAGDSE